MRSRTRTTAVVLCLTVGVSCVSLADVSTASAHATTTTTTTTTPARGRDDGNGNTALQDQLETASDGQAVVAFDDSGGDATYLGGSAAHPLQARSGGGQEAVARRFVDTYAPLFGIVDPSKDLQQTQSFIGDTGTGGAVRYQQTVGGVPVIAGVIAVQVSSEGAVLSATGEATGERGIETTPTVAEQDAARSAVGLTARVAGVDASRLHAGAAKLSVYDPSLLGIDDPLGARLVWQFAVTSAEGDVNRYVLIDAHDATVALQFDQVEAALNRTVCDNHNDNTLSETCAPGSVVRSEGQPAVADGPNVSAANVNSAYDLSGVTYAFYNDRFGRDSLDNAGLPLASTVRHCDPSYACPFANAYWNGSQMVYGDGFATADDVVGHELTHGVTQFTSGLLYVGQSGAINESMSDVMGELIDLTSTVSGADPPSDRWKLGEQIPGGAIRNMANPPLFNDPDKLTSGHFYLGALDNRGVHTNSGVNNKAAALITDGGSFNGQDIVGLGIDKAAKIYYQLETTLLTPGSSYVDLYRQLPQACTNLIGVIGITATDCQQVVKTVTATEMDRKPGSAGTPVTVCSTGVRNAVVFSDDMETDSNNWITSATGNSGSWGYTSSASVSGSRSMHVVDKDGPKGLSTLAMAGSVVVPGGSSYFSFEHSIDTDTSTSGVVYDGGVVEYSVDGGVTWKDIAGSPGSAGPPAVPATPALPTIHGYSVVLSTASSGGATNDLKGRAAFGGPDAGFLTTMVDTSSLAGQSVRFRYVFGIDNYPTGGPFPGWFIDDVSLYGCGNVNVPGAVRSPSAAAGDASATVSWQAPSFDGGGIITSYVITPFLSGIAQTPVNTGSSALSFVVPGLVRGGSYTFIVAAVNSAGTGPASTESSAVVLPAVAPRAPTNVTAVAGDQSAIVSWTPPVDNGGSVITGYVVTPYLGATARPSASASNVGSVVVNGLTNGQPYTFTVTAANGIGTSPASAPSASVTPTAAIPLLPGRILDTRLGGVTVDGRSAGIGVRSAGSVTELTVAGRAGVAADADAVVLNVTVTGPLSAGFVTVYPCGGRTPTASNLNYVTGQTIPNLVVTKIGASGQVCLFTQSATDLIVDVSGYFPPNSALRPVTPARLLETRSGSSTIDGVSNGLGLVSARSVTEVLVGGRAGVPANADAAVLNVTVVGPDAPGYLTVYPCGTEPPTASNVNYSAGQTIADAAITKIGASGKVCVFSQRATDLVVDVNGYLPAGSSLTSLAPARLLDSRTDGTTTDGQLQAIGARPVGSVTEVTVNGRGGVPTGAAAVVLNVTVTEPTAAGYVTVYPCGTEPPTASNLNYGPGLTIANAVISKIGTGGKVCIYTQAQTQLVVDVDAYLAG